MSFLDNIKGTVSSFLNSKKDGDDENDDEENEDAPVVSHDAPKRRHPEKTADGESQEIRDGKLYIDGVYIGDAAGSTVESSGDEILNMLEIPKTYSVPDNVFLPDDLSTVKFDSAPNGFSEDDVLEFYNAVLMTINYYVGLLDKRNADVIKLVNYISKQDSDIRDMKMEMEIQKSGLTVVADDSSGSEKMNLQLKLRKLKAENDELRSRGSDSAMSAKLSELQKRYDNIQDQLAMEQYSKKQLTDRISELQTRLGVEEENSGGIAEDIGSLGSESDETRSAPAPAQPPHRMPSRQNAPVHNGSMARMPSAQRSHPQVSLRRVPKSAPAPSGHADDSDSHTNQSQSAANSSPRRQISLHPAGRPKPHPTGAPVQSPTRPDPNPSHPASAAPAPASRDEAPQDDDSDMFGGGAPFDDVSDSLIPDDTMFDN